AELAGVDHHREGDVRHHALVLGAAAVRQEELGDGQLDLAVALALVAGPAVQVDQVLHRALAEGGLAAHQAAAVVPARAGPDLRRRGRAAVGQHGKRAVPGHAGVAVALDVDPAAGLADLHHRALVDEQAGELDRLVERTAAVAAQVHHHAVHALAAELLEQPGHVAGGRGVVVAVLPPAFEVLVERRQLDHADAALGHIVVGRPLEHLGLGGLFLEPDLRAGEGDAVGLCVHAHGRGDHVQAHIGALRPLDLLDHVVDAPADHVLHRPALALA